MINVRAIPHLYRNVKRWTEILTVLSKYGLADWLAPTNIEFIKDRLSSRAGESIARLTREAHEAGAHTAFLTPGDLGIGNVYARVGYRPAGECVHLSSVANPTKSRPTRGGTQP